MDFKSIEKLLQILWALFWNACLKKGPKQETVKILTQFFYAHLVLARLLRIPLVRNSYQVVRGLEKIPKKYFWHISIVKPDSSLTILLTGQSKVFKISSNMFKSVQDTSNLLKI